MDLIERAMAKMNGQPLPIEDAVLVDNADDLRANASGESRSKPVKGEPVGSGSPYVLGGLVAGGRENRKTQVSKRNGAEVAGGQKVDLKLNRIGAAAYLKPGATTSHVMSAYRRIKRPLLANAYGHGVPAVRNGHRMLVTSAVPGEGKTFTAIHLALSISSELESSVILVDADMVRPSVVSVLGLKKHPGVIDWFTSPRPNVLDLVMPTNVDGLKLVSAGTVVAKSAENLASRTMAGFFDELQRAFPNDIIVVDSPPLLAASETSSLATLMGQVVFVVGSGSTTQKQVDQALELLHPDKLVNIVLNQSTRSSAYESYGY